MSAHAIHLLTPHEAWARRDSLIDLLVDSVEGGASVNFVWPMTRAKAEAWWDGTLASHTRGERLIFTAEAGDRIDGTVQLIPAPQENQAFRSDIAKMLVHRRARRRGVGALLLQAAEHAASANRKTVLVLDTASHEAARLYARAGWQRCGTIPNYALLPDGAFCDTVVFYKLL